jgi:hypothetical protein
MSRYRLLPTPAQQAVLRDHCGHARYVWNLAVEQHAHWHPRRKGAPGYREQCRQLTVVRAGYPWLAADSQTVQQQALRDFARAMTAFFDPANPAGRPSWRKAGRDEGFRIVGRGRQWDVRRVSRHAGQVRVPKAWLNRGILGSGWGLLVRRLEDKAPGRVEMIKPRYAAGHAVTAREGDGVTRPVNREPHLLLPSAY